DSIPKPLVPLRDKPLLRHLLNYLSAAGVSRFVLCVGYKAEMIENFVRELEAPQWQITCVNSGDASMTDRLLDARPHVQGRSLICYGDTLANVDLAALRRTHDNAKNLMTLTVYPLHSPFGIVEFTESGLVTGFKEKPRLPHWINIGYMFCEAKALDLLKKHSDMPEFLETLVQQREMRIHQHEGKHLTINTEKDRQQAESDIIEFYTVMGDYGL
ncbi:MAG: hypothetical protein K8T89_18275, partial [Planctomycetes bacterium]|nr:hypothetical protein [Planctomycetota bacterium]